MLNINQKSIPYFSSEIKYSNYLDYLSSEDKNIKTLIGIDLDFIKSDLIRQKTINDIVNNCQSYTSDLNDTFIHNDNLFIYKDLNDITLIEGVLTMNYSKEFSKEKYQKDFQGLFAMKLYLIATLSKKVIDGKIEMLTTNLGKAFNDVESRVQELNEISVKNAIDFEAYFKTFEDKLQEPLYKRAFKSLHPINIQKVDAEQQERHSRYTDFYGAFAIYEHIQRNNLINKQGLNTPFFHSLFLYGLSSNK